MAMNLEETEAIVPFDGASKGRGKKGKADPLPGDWYCPMCGDLQFARNKECRSCGGMSGMMGMMAGVMGMMMGGKGGKGKGMKGMQGMMANMASAWGGGGGGGAERAVVKQIKDYQKSGEEAQQTWWNHADNILKGPRNPHRWDDAALGDFLKSVGIEPEDKYVGTYEGDRGQVTQIKDFQKSSEANKELWWNHCEQNHKGFRDPNRHRDSDLKSFLISVGIAPDYTVVPPKQEFPKMPGDWDCAQCGDAQFARNTECRKCGAAKPPGAGYKPPQPTNPMYVEQIKEFQRSAPVNKEAWWTHCDTKHKGMRDPSRHSNDELKEFMREHGMTPAGEKPMMPGDWNCAQCGDMQFARNAQCRKCGADKPPGAGYVPPPAAQWPQKGGNDFGGKGGKHFGGKGGKDFNFKGGKDFGGKGGKDFNSKGGKKGKGGKDFNSKGKGDYGGAGGYGKGDYGGAGGFGKGDYGGAGGYDGSSNFGGSYAREAMTAAAQAGGGNTWGVVVPGAQAAPMQAGLQPVSQAPSMADQQAQLLQAWQMQKMQAAGCAGQMGATMPGDQRFSPY